jgi:hypothetical protein
MSPWPCLATSHMVTSYLTSLHKSWAPLLLPSVSRASTTQKKKFISRVLVYLKLQNDKF